MPLHLTICRSLVSHRKRTQNQYILRPFLFVVLFMVTPLVAGEPAPLHRRIDHAVTTAHVGPFATLANDYEFLRRVYLDLIGRTPSSTELREFAHDSKEGETAPKS